MLRNIFKYTYLTKNVPKPKNYRFYSSAGDGAIKTKKKAFQPVDDTNTKDISVQNHVEDLDAALHIGASLFERSKHEYEPTPIRPYNRKVTASKKLYAPKKLETTHKNAKFTFKTTAVHKPTIASKKEITSNTPVHALISEGEEILTTTPVRASISKDEGTSTTTPAHASITKDEEISTTRLVRVSISKDEETSTTTPIRTPISTKNRTKTTDVITKKSKLIDDPDLGLQFLRLQLNDPVLTNLMTTMHSKKHRDKNRQILVEGRRLISEALECKLKMRALIFSQVEQLKLIKDIVAIAQQKMNTKIYKVPQHDLKMWSNLTTPPGLMAIFERPSNSDSQILSLNTKLTALPITVICDNIREPNNLGSIIRSCAAIPCQQIIVTHGCCDPWESKALRGGCSGQFRIPIRDNVNWNDVPFLIPPEVADNCYVFIAENNYEKIGNNSTKINYMNLENVGAHNVLIIGGETHGISVDADNFLQTVGERGKYIYIPIANGIESLNVASALTLLLFELKRHIIKQQNKNDLSDVNDVNDDATQKLMF